jgi:hypothetical protein
MAFQKFQKLPVELRLRIWEFAIDEASFIDGLLTDKQKPVCRMITPKKSPEFPDPPPKLVTLEDSSLGYVCRESRDVLRRHGPLTKARDYAPSTDVVYINNHNSITVPNSLHLKIRHIAIPANFCYEMLKICDAELPDGCDELGWRGSLGWTTRAASPSSGFFQAALVCLPELESVTVVLPPLGKSMPHYADRFPLSMRPSYLKVISHSEIQRIGIRGPKAYRSRLRGSSMSKRISLGVFVKDIAEVWKKEADFHLDDDDYRREIKVQAGVLQYFERALKGKSKLSSIYEDAVEVEETSTAGQEDGLP